MADEPTLPVLPRPLGRGRLSPPLLGDRRKRARGTNAPPSVLSSASSDPAIFSSDDDPALDNYVQGRRKKRYVGTWYDQHPASSDSADSAMGDDMRSRPMPKPPKRQFRRQLDSGVYLGLEGSTDTDESVDLEPVAAKIPLPPRPLQPLPLQSVARIKLSHQEEVAREIVGNCVDDGRELVDLCDLGLSSIARDVLEPLTGFALIPTVAKDVAFEQKDPSIKVFLGNNLLRKFPTAIIDIEYLTVLSLRGNGLQELPPTIASLKNLQVLNIAQNSLRCLPAELLELMQKGSLLQDLQLHPNPYYQPEERSFCRWGTAEYEEQTFDPVPEFEVETAWSGITTILRSRTPVQFIDSAQRIHSSFSFPPTGFVLPYDSRKLEQEDFWEVAVPKDNRLRNLTHESNPARKRRGPPSLFEVALRAAMSASEVDQLSSMLVDDDIPEHLASVMDKAVDIRHMGGQRCCVCHKETWSPAAEWLEFREVQRTTVKLVERGGTQTEVEQSTKMANNSDESWVPFMRKGCSWSCIPQKSSQPPSSEERTRLLLLP